jgi:hypothetical protein
MVFAVLHSANTECTALLQPDADGMTGRPQVAAVICRFRIFRSTSHWEHVLRQEPRDRLDLDCMHTGIDKAWSTQRDSMQQCLPRRTVQPALQLGVAVSYAEHWAGWPGKNCMELLALYCSIYAAAHWTDLRSHLAQAVKHNQPAEKCCRQAARQSATKYLQCLQYQLLHLCMELTMTLAYGMHSRRKRMFERCRQATQQPCKKETRRAWELVYQCLRNLQCLVAFTAGRNTVHDTVPAAAVICNF